jgi:hypothetical protein
MIVLGFFIIKNNIILRLTKKPTTWTVMEDKGL